MELLFALLIAALGSLLPTIVYCGIAWWLDRYEKEPLWLMALAFIWGCVPAIILSLVAEVGLMAPLAAISPEADFSAVGAVIFAPLVEETFKGIPLIVMFLAYRKEFDGLMDGLLYGALVGFGFAMTENFLYILGAYQEGGMGALFVTLVLRTIVFGLMHALWTSMFGLGLGMARYANSLPLTLIPPFAGLGLGMLLHAIHNFGATQGGLFLIITFGSYSLGCIAWLVLVVIAGNSEATWIREELVEEVNNGLLTQEQAMATYRYRSRVKARWAGLQRHGAGHAITMGTLYSKAAKLAMKKRQFRIHPHDSTYVAEIGKLRVEISQLQAKLARVYQTFAPPNPPTYPGGFRR